MTCYTSSLISITILSFQLVSNLGLNELHEGENRMALAATCFFAVLMYLFRLHILTKSGHNLGNKIRKSVRVLEDGIISKRISSQLKEESCNKLFVLRKRLEVYQYLSPIAPYSVFSLNHRTFCATLATVLSYILVLLKLRGVETSAAQAGPNDINKTVNSQFWTDDTRVW